MYVPDVRTPALIHVVDVMLLLTTNRKPRYIIHGVPKDTLITLHTPQRALYFYFPFISSVTMYRSHKISGSTPRHGTWKSIYLLFTQSLVIQRTFLALCAP